MPDSPEEFRDPGTGKDVIAPGTSTFGLKVDVTRSVAAAGNKTPADGTANPTDAQDAEAFLMGFNGTTWDRVRSNNPQADNDTTIPNQGAIYTTAILKLFNGSGSDRARGASATVLANQSGLGAQLVTGPGQWSVKDEPAANTAASATKAAGGVGVRHVCTAFMATYDGKDATPTSVTVQIKDGTTVIWAGRLNAPNNDSRSLSMSGLNLVGTANTAMSCNVSAPGTNSFVTASISGYDVS